MRGASTWIDRARVLVAIAILALGVVAISQQEVTSLPPNPHASLSVKGQCGLCHATYLDTLEPHEFVVSISEICLQESCHTTDKLGRSHPVGVEVKRSRVVTSVPESLPLEDGRISCGSCHQPHAEWLSVTPCYLAQPPVLTLVTTESGAVVEKPHYRSYYLRVAGSPDEGYLPLCISCHPR